MKIPETLDECYMELDKISDFSQWLQESEEIATAGAHHSIGMWIRNNWNLWSGGELSKWFNRNGINHPDDMSNIILTSFYRYKNNQDIKLEEQLYY